MKSKKIERLEKEIRELKELEYVSPDYFMNCKDSILADIARKEKEITATRNRNLWARERNAAYRDCGLTRCVVNGKVFWE
jgi:hypothetical protein